MLPKFLNVVLCKLVAATVLCASHIAIAQTAYPNKPVRVVVPFAAGAGVDAFGRAVSRRLAEQLGQPFVVENKLGAGGLIGNASVADAEADGYTLLATTDTSVYLTPQVVKGPNFDSMKSLASVAIGAATPAVIVVHPSLPVKNLQELIEYTKKATEPLAYGTPGAGSLNHLAGEALALATGAKLMHVPYKGAAPALTDLLAGHIKMGIMILPSAAAHIDSGKLRAIAVIGDQRSKFQTEIPTLAEAGVKDVVLPDTRLGFWAPAGTPPALVERLNSEIEKALKDPSVRSSLEKAGLEIKHQSVKASSAGGEESFKIYQRLVSATKIAPN